MGDVWIRTANQGLIRADKVTEIGTSRGSVHEETGYAVKAVAGGKAFTLIDDSDLMGTQTERLDHARQMQDALLLAIDTASDANPSMVISYERDREGWMLTPASDLASDFPPLRYTKN
ncbi:hypothetical protein [Pseudarthrobacter sp. S9]|uniref:hypothetical protein n=1 Tax=Pseudarthrobacter sp. S9 TaxID=3418421 RepID=UPI003D01EA39